jgi:4-oxalocrotonate tautomerase
MPVLRVSMHAGRTKEQKAELAKALTEVMVRIAKTPAEATSIIFEEVEKSNWATGGVLASDK